MNRPSQILKCLKCQSKNRVLLDRASKPVCGKCGEGLNFPDTPITVTDGNFKNLVSDSGLPVLLDLWATWCPPCKMLAPILDEISKEMSGKFIVGKLDVDSNPVIAGKFGVQSIPTILIIKEGKEVDRIVGLQSKAAIISKMRTYL